MTFLVGDRMTLECNIENTGVLIDAKWIRDETEKILVTTNFSSSASANSKSLYHGFYYVIQKGPVDAWYKLLVQAASASCI